LVCRLNFWLLNSLFTVKGLGSGYPDTIFTSTVNFKIRNKPMKRFGLIAIVAIALVLLMGGCGTYNSLVGKEENVRNAWSQVETQYQRRSDLIPNLVNTVKGAANFEKETLTEVINARARATSITVDPNNLSPEQIQKFQQAQQGLSSALGRLLAVAEAYPQLRATEAFRDLQAQLEGTENRIAVSRNRFNDAVNTYNVSRRTFPANIFAGMFGFEQKGYFEAQPGSDKAPTVQF
jgi:LemA protein